MSLATNLAAAAYTALACVLAGVALHAAAIARSRRTALLSVAFLLMAGKGILLSVALFLDPSWTRWLVPSLVLDAAALMAIYLALLNLGP